MGNLTWEKVTKDLYTAVLIIAGCTILGAIFGLLDLLQVPFTGVLDLILSIGGAVVTVWFCILLGHWQKVADPNDVPAIKKLWLYSLLGIIAAVVDVIPLMGWVAGILEIVAFVFFFLGVSALKKSTTLPENALNGAKKLHLVAILLLVGAVVGIIPLLGAVEGIIAIVAWVLNILAWKKIANA